MTCDIEPVSLLQSHSYTQTVQHIDIVANKMGEEPKKGRLTLYENLLSKDTLREMQARDAAKMADEAKKKKDGTVL